MELKAEEWTELFRRLTESLKLVYGHALKAVILYGSVAKGTADKDSDIDIMVLVDTAPEKLKEYEEKLSDVSTSFALEYFKVFSIIDVSYREYEEWKSISPFYKNVSKEGVTLYAA